MNSNLALQAESTTHQRPHTNNAGQSRFPTQVPKRKPVPTFSEVENVLAVAPLHGSGAAQDDKSKAKDAPQVTITRQPSNALTLTTTLSATYLRLDRPIVIPSVCVLDKAYHPIGLPFIRAYPPCLASYDIDSASFLSFIDHLNIKIRGHTQTFKNLQRAGKAVHTIGNLDPTQITKLVGLSIQVTAQAGNWMAIEGPVSRKKGYLEDANKTIFHPRSLHAKTVDTGDLKKLLKVGKDYCLMAPLETSWDIKTKEELKMGQRSTIRTPKRILMALKEHVQDVQLMAEANPITCGRETDDLMIDEAERKLFKSNNALDVKRLQVGAEITNELARKEALELLRTAEAMKATAEKEVKKKMKLYKKAQQKDREMHATKKMRWLVITNLEKPADLYVRTGTDLGCEVWR